MSVKMECDNCHTQVTTEGMGNHGWILVNQQLLFNQLGEVPIAGTFCTVSCTTEWLRGKDPANIKIETPEQFTGQPKEKFDEKFDGDEGRNVVQRGLSVHQFPGKAGEILRKVVGTDEPIAIFRARDLLSIFVLQAYGELLERYGAHYDQQESWTLVRDDFRNWQNSHRDQVRLPD